jgi:hypothetical protein
MPTLPVAETILEQLGGRKFRVMTGASKFVGSATSLSFNLPGGGGFCKQGINRVHIELLPSDTYTMTFYRFRRGSALLVAAIYPGLYFDQLQDIFTSVTGLVTSLGAR